jgi:hypothetical protein
MAAKTNRMNGLKGAAEFTGPIDSTGRCFPAAGPSPAFGTALKKSPTL